MPCFKGIAVSIHAAGSPLPEYGIQRQSRVSRMSTYIPVPQPQLDKDSNKPDPTKFAISITLLTPGLPIPYSTPKATDANPYPKPQLVGDLPGAASSAAGGQRGSITQTGAVTPYIPMTNSENETIAAYIYFDGRAKEEVATLLRPGEETWVNSRWVQVPEAEGGGLAEREFLFREVGLEKWLNGLDLKGHDAAEKVEKRRQKFERRRRRQASRGVGPQRRDSLRYGADDKAPLEAIDSMSASSSEDDDDDDEPPEATGQIKVAMFRVLASGEIKNGEYSPQFDAHDDDDDDDDKMQNGDGGGGGGGGGEADVEHTTSFAKPKTLDPKSISTQTVTGIDGPDKPYATFTFFYRGDRQLQKIGVMSSAKLSHAAPGSAKRRSGQLDFSSLGPIKAGGSVGFSGFRDQDAEALRRRKSRKKSVVGTTKTNNIEITMNDDDDSDGDEDEESDLLSKMKDVAEAEDPNNKKARLGPEDNRLADEVGRIRLKRAHSAEPDSLAAANHKDGAATTPPSAQQDIDSTKETEPQGSFGASSTPRDESMLASPLKKQRPSLGGELDRSDMMASLDQAVVGSFAADKPSTTAAAAAAAAATEAAVVGSSSSNGNGLGLKAEEEEEEL